MNKNHAAFSSRFYSRHFWLQSRWST